MAFIATGIAITAVASVGSAYAQNKSAQAQQRAANVQNKNERLKALRQMRMASRAAEVIGVGSGTYGGTGMTGAIAGAASKTASAIGEQSALLAAARDASKWNQFATGMGALASVGGSLAEYGKAKKAGLV